ITAEISPATILKGVPFIVSGVAEGIPKTVQVWILGKNYYAKSILSVNADASFKYVVPQEVASHFSGGQYFVIVQHPMENTTFDVDVRGDYVRSLQPDNGGNLFRISGPGSLQGSDAADALVAAFSDPRNGDDTYTEIPFQVTDSGNIPVSGAFTGTGVTITADGDKSYFLGEKVVFRGQNTDSDSTYLFLTGPNLQATGVKLTSPDNAAVSGNPDSFTVVKTKPDKTWEYSFYTANLPFDAGTYTIYAESQPETKDQLGRAAVHVSIILKKPFITAEISPVTISNGAPFTVSGVAEGIPPDVQVWILGNNYYSNSTVSVKADDASYRYEVPKEVTSRLENGQYFVIVQHPMADNQFDFVVSGDYVRNLKLNNGTNVFRISGPGSLQGSDAADALIAAISDQETNDHTSSAHDTYTIVPFLVTDEGSPIPQATAATTGPDQSPAQTALLPFALTGAFVLVLGIVVWKRY
ncbi:MAG: hypothetical protein WC294_10710, partial [Methanoregula sp.]